MFSNPHDSALSDGQEIRSSRICDLPVEQRPREKLARLGAGSLANDELLALFISTGMKGLSAIEIGRNLIQKYGSMGALGSLSVSQLAKEKGLGLAKASKLAAAFELGSRVAREQSQNVPFDTPQQAYAYFGPQMCHLAKEQVVVAILDTRLRLIGTEIVSIGTVNESNAHPREIFRPVICRGGYSFILIHNHPSGDPSPSRADERVTKALIDASEFMQISMLDHLIIGRSAEGRAPYFSFREAGIVH
jgi:DNA repair protein RadC